MAKILIVENDPDLLDTYADLLMTRGHGVMSASNTSGAVDLIHSSEPDLVIIDLPMSGKLTSEMIRTIQPDSRHDHFKVVVVSGHPEVTNNRELKNLADLILIKPVANVELIRVVDQFISDQLQQTLKAPSATIALNPAVYNEYE